VHTQNCQTHADAQRVPASHTLKRLVENVAAHLRPKPDRSLVNEKFTDSFEREFTERYVHNRW
jgi:hypothetical protein